MERYSRIIEMFNSILQLVVSARMEKLALKLDRAKYLKIKEV